MELRVVLVEPEYEGNVGSIARAMRNFGFKELWMVNPKCAINEKAQVLASHACDVLANTRIVQTLQDAIQGCDLTIGTTAIFAKKSSNILRTVVAVDEVSKEAVNSACKVGLILGRESRGLSNNELSQCDLVVTIPASEEYGTLNVSAACAILLYEFSKTTHKKRFRVACANRLTKERLVRCFENLAVTSGEPKHKQRLAVRALRNLVSRQFISQREALVLMGIFRRATELARQETLRPESSLK